MGVHLIFISIAVQTTEVIFSENYATCSKLEETQTTAGNQKCYGKVEKNYQNLSSNGQGIPKSSTEKMRQKFEMFGLCLLLC